MTDQAPKILSAEEIEQAPDLEGCIIAVPEWRGSVAVRKLPARDYVAFQGDMAAYDKKDSIEAVYVQVGRHLAKADWTPIYENDEQAIAALSKRSLPVLVKLQNRINAMYKEEADRVKKDSGGTTPVVSPIDSPSGSDG